jgi:hypothetical protein
MSWARRGLELPANSFIDRPLMERPRRCGF